MCESFLSFSDSQATLIATFAALLAGFLGYIHNYRRHIQEYTFNMISPLLVNDKLVAGYYFMSCHVCNGTLLDHDEMTADERALAIQILGYYEFLSSALLNKVIDRNTVLSQRSKDSFRSTYDVSHRFIETRRKLLRRPSVYRDFQTFVERYCQ